MWTTTRSASACWAAGWWRTATRPVLSRSPTGIRPTICSAWAGPNCSPVFPPVRSIRLSPIIQHFVKNGARTPIHPAAKSTAAPTAPALSIQDFCARRFPACRWCWAVSKHRFAAHRIMISGRTNCGVQFYWTVKQTLSFTAWARNRLSILPPCFLRQPHANAPQLRLNKPGLKAQFMLCTRITSRTVPKYYFRTKRLWRIRNC